MTSPFVEPELRGPVPRRVVTKSGLRVARAAVFVVTTFVAVRMATFDRFSVAPLLGVTALAALCWGPFEFRVARQRRLLEFGTATEGRMVEWRHARSALRVLTEFAFFFLGHFHYGSTLRARYEYAVEEGRRREVERALDDDAIRWLGGPGNHVTVLMDPMDENHHALYPSLGRWLRVVPPPEGIDT
jgi:hypothetical protein